MDTKLESMPPTPFWDKVGLNNMKDLNSNWRNNSILRPMGLQQKSEKTSKNTIFNKIK